MTKVTSLLLWCRLKKETKSLLPSRGGGGYLWEQNSFGVLEHIMLMNDLSMYEGSYRGSNKHAIYGYTTA